MSTVTAARPWPYAVAVAATAVAAALKLLLGPVIVPGAFLTAYGAVLLSAWYGGLGPAFLAIVLSIGIDTFLFLPFPVSPAGHEQETALRVGLFLLIAGLISWVTTYLRASQQRIQEELRSARDELDVCVQARTAELLEANQQLREEISQRRQTEAAVEEGRNFVSAVLDTVGALVAVVDAEGRIARFNRACEHTTGYSFDEVKGKHLWDLFLVPEDVEPAKLFFRDLSKELLPQTYDAYWVTRNGSRRLIAWSMTLLATGQSELHLIGTGIDITDRRAAEDALRQARDGLEAGIQERTAELQRTNRQLRDEILQRERTEQARREGEERFRVMADTAPVMIWMAGLDTECTYFNTGWLEFTGRTLEEEVGLGWAAGLHPEDYQKTLDTYVTAFEARRQFTTEYRLRRFDGEYRWIWDSGTPRFTPSGSFAGYIGSCIDITDRKHAEQSLAELNRRIVSILESINDGFVVLDERGCFTYLNPSAERLLQRPRHSLLGKQVWEEFPEGVNSAFHVQYQRVMVERVPVDIEAYSPPLHRWLRSHASPSQQGMSVLFEDVTERHEAEVTAISDILRALNAELNVADAFESVATGLQVLTGCDRSSFTLFDAAREWVTVVALDRPRTDVAPGTRLRMSDIPAAANILEGRPHIVPDLSVELHSPIVQKIYGAGYRSVFCLPLRGTAEILGMLTLTWRKPNGGSYVHLPLLVQIADAVALAVEKNRLFDQVREGREQLRALSRRLLEVQEAERHHIARELHDEVGQALTGLKLALDGLTRLPGPAATVQVAEAHKLVNDLVMRVRDLSLDLRPAMLDDLGLLPALLWLFGRYTAQTSIQVNFEHSGIDRRFAAELETGAYRITQEALTNVARHAGVTHVVVRAWADLRVLSVQIVDLGVGFDPEAALHARTSSGLAGMRERALLLQGQLTIESALGKGTRVVAELPLQAAPSVEVPRCP